MSENIMVEQNPENVELAPRGTTSEMMISRQAQEVQAAIVIAKRFPRDQVEAYNRVLNACKRKKLAENATYEFPRGGTKVTGPSIRLAEAIAQNWGNIDFGITELERKDGESQVMAYAWDLETNTRQTRIFTVRHVRQTKTREYALTDERDIYEMVANYGARRLRACILGVVPGDVVDAAVEQCDKTLADSNNGMPLVDVVRSMAQHFKDEFGVPLAALEKYIGWKSDSFSMQDVVRLKKVYNALKDGMAKKEEIFDLNASSDDGQPIDAFATKKQEQPKQEEKKQEAPAEKKKQEGKQPEQSEDDYAKFEQMYMGSDNELPWN